MSKLTFKIKFFLLIFLVASLQSNVSSYPQEFNAGNFYGAIASDDILKINEQLKIVERSSSTVNKAYKGALLMKKAGFEKSPRSKLKTFKQGRLLLEEAITTENKNAGFRFLRLIIQENCPGILNYRGDREEDAKAVKQDFKNFSPELKHAVINYSKVSKTLKPGDFAN